jgi:nitrite reductase/ring-hydroxylating ferredoxin subunit
MTERPPHHPAEPTPRTSTSSTSTPRLRTGEPRHDLHTRVSLLTDRRGVLKAAVVVAGAGTLAACSSPPVQTEPPAGGDSPAPSGTATADIPVGGGKVYPDSQVVVTQPSAGQFKAFSAICTHQGCLVGMVEGGHIICPCHGSQFDITTGAPTPDSLAQTPLGAKTVHVTGNTFTVS